MSEKKVCGTCKYHQFENVDDGYVCVNGESEYLSDWTDFNHTCDCWEAEMKEIIKTGLFAILMIVFLYFLSWILTCGIIELITVCFGWGFKWTVATGIWLIMCVIQSIFHKKD